MAIDTIPFDPRELPIGVFDSGVGGITVVRALRQVLPEEDIVYLGDTARVPYGTKSPDTVIRYSCEDMQFLLRHRVKAVIVGCSTVSACALPTLEKTFDVPVFGVVLPGVRAALAQTRNRRIGVIATNTTIRSSAYTRAILARCETAKVFAGACPLLIPLVEEGWMEHRATPIILQDYLAQFRHHNVDTLILACTHFPYLKSAIQKVMGDHVALIDCADTCAYFARERLLELKLLCENRPRPGLLRTFVTDEPERFTRVARQFLGEEIEPAAQVALQS